VHGLGKAGRFPVNTGPINTMSTVTAQEVHLYKVTGTNYAPVHTVKLRKRNPITWIKDSLGLNKYAKENKMTLSELGFHKTAGAQAEFYKKVKPLYMKMLTHKPTAIGHAKGQAAHNKLFRTRGQTSKAMYTGGKHNNIMSTTENTLMKAESKSQAGSFKTLSRQGLTD